MIVKELIEQLKTYPQDSKIILASDEEMNVQYTDMKVCTLEIDKSNNKGTYDACLIYPLSGSELF